MAQDRFIAGFLPDLDSLRCFEAAARTLNFRAAARQVALSPAAFGQRIRGLEDQLGTQLFARSSRSVTLTEAGLSLLPRALACLEAAAACVAAIPSALRARPQRISLGTRFELGMSWIVPRLEELDAALPFVTLDLYFGSGPDLLVRVSEGLLHCAVTSARLPDANLDGEALHEERYAFVAAPSLLAELAFDEPEHAARHVLLDTGPDLPLFRYLRDAPGMRSSLRFADQRYLGLGAAIHQQVVLGKGVAVLPRYMIEEDLVLGRLAILFESIELESDHFRLVFRAEDPLRELFSTLAEALRARPIT